MTCPTTTLALLYRAAIPSLADHRELLTHMFFNSVLQPLSCLSALLPNQRDASITTRLKTANKSPRLPTHTRQYQTFISYTFSLPNCISILLSIILFKSFLDCLVVFYFL